MKYWEVIGFVGKMQGVSGLGAVGMCHGARAAIAWHELPRMCLHTFPMPVFNRNNTPSSTSNLTSSP